MTGFRIVRDNAGNVVDAYFDATPRVNMTKVVPVSLLKRNVGKVYRER